MQRLDELRDILCFGSSIYRVSQKKVSVFDLKEQAKVSGMIFRKA